MTDGLDEQQDAVLQVLFAMQRQPWEQGVLSHAVLDLGLEDAAEAIARDAVARQTAAGGLGEIPDVALVDSGALGEVVGWAAERTGDPQLRAGFDRQLAWLLRDAPRAADGTLFHGEDGQEVRADTVYMTVPLLVSAGEPGAARTQLIGHRERLWDAASGLYGWEWSENEGCLTHPHYRGTGNGWVVAAIARAMRLGLAADTAFAAQATDHARTVIDAVLGAAHGAGGFHNALEAPATFPEEDLNTFPEENVRQQVAYAILAGVRDDWLPRSYRQAGLDLVSEARQAVDNMGFVGGACGVPRFDNRGTSPEAQAFFLLATHEAQNV